MGGYHAVDGAPRFSAIARRPKLELPDGARLAVWVIANVEEWDPTQPMPRTVLTPPAGGEGNRVRVERSTHRASSGWVKPLRECPGD